VTTNVCSIPQIEALSDSDLPDLLDQENARQLLHLTYGFLLKSELRDRIFKTLIQYEEDYGSLLDKHIEKHLESLGAERRN
jgi:hypothetical protein